MRNTHLLRIAYSYLPALSDTTLAVYTFPLSQTTLDPPPSFLVPWNSQNSSTFQITTSYSVSLIKPSIPQRRRITCLLRPRWPENLSLRDISRAFRVLSITRFVRPSTLFCFCYSKKSSSPWELVQVVQERPRSVELFPSVT